MIWDDHHDYRRIPYGKTLLAQRILFVCCGNICRSPMAAKQERVKFLDWCIPTLLFFFHIKTVVFKTVVFKTSVFKNE
jgi:hypothetical protein